MTRSKNKVVVVVSGGNVQEIYSDVDVDVFLVDFDNIESGDEVDDEPYWTAPLPTLPEEIAKMIGG